MKENRAIFCIIPVREFDETKLRMRYFLSKDKRAELTSSMLSHTISVLAKSRIKRILIVCSNKEQASQLRKRFREEKLLVMTEKKHHGGVNAAVRNGIEYFSNHYKADSIMVIPSDLPLLSESKVDYAVSKLNSYDLIITPSTKKDGTNLLLFNLPRGTITLHYDDDSYNKHERYARKHNISYLVLDETEFSTDVDSKEDLQLVANHFKAKSFNEILKSISGGK